MVSIKYAEAIENWHYGNMVRILLKLKNFEGIYAMRIKRYSLFWFMVFQTWF